MIGRNRECKTFTELFVSKVREELPVYDAKEPESSGSSLLAGLFVSCLVPAAFLWQGWVLNMFYEWFIGLGSLGTARAAGLLVVFRLLRGCTGKEDAALPGFVLDVVTKSLVLPGVLLLCGWWFKCLMDLGW